MVDKLEALAAAEKAGLLRAALKGRVADLGTEIDDLRRQVAAKEQDRDFLVAEDDKAKAALDGIVDALVADGMEEKAVRQIVDTRVKMMVDLKVVDVQVPVPGSGRSRAAAPRKARGGAKAEAAGADQQQAGQQPEDATAVDGGQPGGRNGDAEAPGAGAGAGDEGDGRMTLPPMEGN